jgi:hypothetical protein
VAYRWTCTLDHFRDLTKMFSRGDFEALGRVGSRIEPLVHLAHDSHWHHLGFQIGPARRSGRSAFQSRPLEYSKSKRCRVGSVRRTPPVHGKGVHSMDTPGVNRSVTISDGTVAVLQ